MKFRRTPQEKVRDEFYGNLNRIVKTSKQVIKGWKTTAIPLDSLNTIITMSKYNTDELKKQLKNENKAVVSTSINLFDVFNKTLDSLYKTCVAQAKHMETKSIPIEILKSNINKIKESFTEGMNNGV